MVSSVAKVSGRNSRGRPGIISAVYDSPRTNNNLVGVYRLHPPEIGALAPWPAVRPAHCINNEWRQPNFHCYIISYGLHTPHPPLCPSLATVHSHTREKKASTTSSSNPSALYDFLLVLEQARGVRNSQIAHHYTGCPCGVFIFINILFYDRPLLLDGRGKEFASRYFFFSNFRYQGYQFK